MDRLRFPLLLGVALATGAMGAHAQSSPTVPAAQTPAPAKIEDIEIAQDGETVTILVKFSGQPSAASARADGTDIKLDIDGIAITPLSLVPPPGSLIARVTASKGEVVLGGAALSTPEVIVYRQAVLVKAKLAEPAAIGGASLMTGQQAATPIAIAPQPPLPVFTSLPKPAPTPVTPAPPPPAPLPTASVAGIDAARCTAAADELAKDSWALGAMGDLALCLIDQNKPEKARAKLDQLGAITPQDWRVSFGRAVLASDAGETENASAFYLAASEGAPNEAARDAIVARMNPEAPASLPEDKPVAADPTTPDNDLQLPLPK